MVFRGPHMEMNHAETKVASQDEKEINADLALETNRDDVEVVPVVFKCSLCRKPRYVGADFEKLEDVRCTDYGRSCEDVPDFEKLEDVPEHVEIFDPGEVQLDTEEEELKS